MGFCGGNTPHILEGEVNVVVSYRSNWVLGFKALHGNPFDGHTQVTCPPKSIQVKLPIYPIFQINEVTSNFRTYSGRLRL